MASQDKTLRLIVGIIIALIGLAGFSMSFGIAGFSGYGMMGYGSGMMGMMGYGTGAVFSPFAFISGLIGLALTALILVLGIYLIVKSLQ